MALSRAKYRRVPELYVVGTELVLKDGSVIWLQVLNPFERDECAHDAQVARARMVLAIKNGDERLKIEAVFFQDGRGPTIEKLADVKASNHIVKIVEELSVDPLWKERIEIMDRADDILASSEEAEKELVTKINEDYLQEVLDRQRTEFQFQVERLTRMDDERLLEEYVEHWVDRRGTDVARTEYQLTEAWYAARACEGIQTDGVWDHSMCEGHRLTVWDSKAEVRDLAEELAQLITDTLAKLNMSARDARFSDRQGSSSDSSPLPSEAAESTPSTPTATPASVPGS